MLRDLLHADVESEQESSVDSLIIIILIDFIFW